jgi:hypothetical protein
MSTEYGRKLAPLGSRVRAVRVVVRGMRLLDLIAAKIARLWALGAAVGAFPIWAVCLEIPVRSRLNSADSREIIALSR